MVDFNKLRGKPRREIPTVKPTDFDYLLVEDLKFMSIIWSTELMSFGDLCNAMKQADQYPEDKTEWATLFNRISDLEKGGWLLVDRMYNRTTKRNEVQTIVLSDQGADAVRHFADGKRPLIVQSEQRSDKSWEENKHEFLGDNGIPF